MKKQEFIYRMNKLIENSCYGEDNSTFICHEISYIFPFYSKMKSEFRDFFKAQKDDKYFNFTLKNGIDTRHRIDNKEATTRRVFALQVFMDECLEHKLYRKF